MPQYLSYRYALRLKPAQERTLPRWAGQLRLQPPSPTFADLAEQWRLADASTSDDVRWVSSKRHVLPCPTLP